MSRNWLNFVTGVSAILALATILLSGRSYWRHDSVFSQWRSLADREVHSRRITSVHGRVYLLWTETREVGSNLSEFQEKYPEGLFNGRRRYWTGPARQIGRESDYFGFNRVVRPVNANTWDDYFILPYWPFIALFAALPMVRGARWALGLRRERRRRLGLCVSCGYDLRGGHDVCPECGAPARLDCAVRAEA